MSMMSETEEQKEGKMTNQYGNSRKRPSQSTDEAPSQTKKIHTCKSEPKVFCDPVHGHIVLDSILVKIIDTPQFQRLRNIKQLGGKYFVYPGASHNRFEHSLGVAYLAGKLIEKIKAKQPKLKINRRDILCLKIAGLCHDLGHGPFSHVWDGCVLPEISPKSNSARKQQKKWKHEEGSLLMLGHLIEENNMILELKELDEYEDLGDEDKKMMAIEQDINFIKKLILPESGLHENTGREEDKSFLYEIISNKTNGIDVDKWDYFKRDCHHLGITCIFDINRAMEFVRVIDCDDDQKHICFRDKEGRNLYQMFQTRELLHRMAYQHKTARAVERMLTEALVLADDTEIRIPGKRVPEGKRLSECHLHPDAFTNLTDHIFQLILTSTKATEATDLKPDSMQGAKDLLNRIQKRDLYKQIGTEEPAPSPNRDAKEIAEEIAGFSENGELTADNLYVDQVTFDFGMKEKDPFEFIWFFKKDEPDKAIKIPLQKISTFLPEHFQEKVIRVYSKKNSEVEKAERCFDLWKQHNEKQGDTCTGKESQSSIVERLKVTFC